MLDLSRWTPSNVHRTPMGCVCVCVSVMYTRLLWARGVCVRVCVCMHAQAYHTLCDPMYCSPPGSSVHGILPLKKGNRQRCPGMGSLVGADTPRLLLGVTRNYPQLIASGSERGEPERELHSELREVC